MDENPPDIIDGSDPPADDAAEAGRIAEDVRHRSFRVSGLDCPDCAATLDKSVSHIDGVYYADLNFATGLLFVEYDPRVEPTDEIVSAVRRMGYGVQVIGEAGEPEHPEGWLSANRLEVATAASGVLIVLGWLLGLADAAEASTAAFAGAIVAGGRLTARRAVGSAMSRSLDMNVLMTVAVIGAMAIGEWSEGAMVVFLYALGGVLEARSLTRTRRSISELLHLAPETATVRRGDEEIRLPPEEIGVGETLVVRAGERVPLDGRVTRGAAAVDESPVTGESTPVAKEVGDEVYAGTLDADGLIEVEVTALAEDSTLSRIVYLVEEAQAQKAPAQRLVDRFTRYYTPAVIALAVGIAVAPPVVSQVLGADWGGFGEWFYRGLVLLVVSCPCALVISTPVAVVSAITNAARKGMLVKGGAFLEIAADVRAVAFDKTGTLTHGRPEVAEVTALGDRSSDRVLEIAALLETGSTHPIAKAVVRAAGVSGEVGHLDRFRDEAGRGVRGTIDGVAYGVASPEAAQERGVPYHDVLDAITSQRERGMTSVVVYSGEEAIGVIGVADAVRADAADTVRGLLEAGIQQVVMLTGDHETTAEAVAGEAGVTDRQARLMPADKVASVRELKRRYGMVAMVGDGINDAPALAAADLGIAMGAAGSDTAIETANVALLGDDLSVLPQLFRLGRRTVNDIRQNVMLAVTVKLAVLVLAVFGVATLWMAVFADTGVALLVIFNGLRLLR